MVGIIEEGEGPEPGSPAVWMPGIEGEGPEPASAAGLNIGTVELPGYAAEADPELLADRLRFMGIADDLVVDFEERCRFGIAPALQWLEGVLDDLDEPTVWSCNCGVLLVDGSWRGRAVMRCSECGSRWDLEVRTAREGSLRLLCWPHQEWLDQQRQEEDLEYGDHPPEQVLLHGLPAMRDRIDPGESWPLAVWVDGRHGAVFYVKRLLPAEVDDLGNEYKEEVEYLQLDPADGWVGVGSGGGDWFNPFDPPRQLLDKYKVFATGVSGFSADGGSEAICLTGGMCCNAVRAVEVRDRSGVKLVEVDPDRHTFLVGSSSPPGHIRFLGHDQQPILGHDDAPLELTLSF